MPRQPILAFGLVALALSLGPGLSSRVSAAAEPQHKEAAPTGGGGAVHPAAATPSEELSQAEGHGGGEPNILEPQPRLAVWTVVVFLGLLFVLGRFAWKPLLNALHQREEHLEHVLVETERAR